MKNSKLTLLLRQVEESSVRRTNLSDNFAEILNPGILRTQMGGRVLQNTSCGGTNAECNNYSCQGSHDGVCQNNGCGIGNSTC
jgi:hypothetical protein